ncbi:MAG: hypothetical protein ACREND_02205 [Gemmatimonadaceae bacterium]
MSVSSFRRCLSRVLAAAAVAGALACGSATSPTPAQNAELIARFDSLRQTSQRLHSLQLGAAINLLADGAPVRRAQVVIDGKASAYSVIAEYDVEDIGTVPADSFLTIFAWTGDHADTLVEFDVGNNVGVLITNPVDLFAGDIVPLPPGTGTSKPAGTCATVHATIPSGSTMRRGDICQTETVTFSLSTSLNNSPAPDLVLDVPSQGITAIRQEFFGPTP